MKIRNGFVSNSSSSSFVVAFPVLPKSVEEVKNILFEDENTLAYYNEVYSTYEIAETVFHDIKNQKPNNKKKIKEYYTTGWFPGHPQFPETSFNDPNWQEILDEYNKKTQRIADNNIAEFMLKHKNAFIYCFSYADGGGGYYSALEHGGIFDRLDRITISNH